MVVDGIELLRMIKDGKIKDHTVIKNHWCGQYWVCIGKLLYWSDKNGNIKNVGIDWYRDKSKTSVVSTYHLVNTEEVEIIEDEEIDIQAIEELDKKVAYTNIDFEIKWDKKEQIIIEKQNEIIKAIKQLDKKIK